MGMATAFLSFMVWSLATRPEVLVVALTLTLTLSVRPQNILPVAKWCWTGSRELVRSC